MRPGSASAAATGRGRYPASGLDPRLAAASNPGGVPGSEGLPVAGRKEPAVTPAPGSGSGPGNMPDSTGAPGGSAPSPELAAADRGPASPPARLLRAGERHRVEFLLNGERRAGEAPPRLLLSDFLRGGFGRRGVHVGCEHGVCGACTVWVDGAPHRSCLTLAGLCEGQAITTLEGLNTDAQTQALQAKLVEKGAFQCGFCAPGMIMALRHFVATASPDSAGADVRRAISGNLCRCTGYVKIVEAVEELLAEART